MTKKKRVIRRENIKGHYFVVARHKGRIVARQKWNKDFMLDKAATQFKKTRSFSPSIKRTAFTNVFEVVDSSTTPVRPSQGFFQYFVSSRFRNQTFTARSSRFPVSAGKNAARNEAIFNLAARMVGGADYRMVELNRSDVLNRAENITIEDEGIVYYSKK